MLHALALKGRADDTSQPLQAGIFRLKRAAPKAPAGRRLYAIGDIHGRADLLEALLKKISIDARTEDLPTTLLFLGDYVDRGPQSRAVIDRLLRLRDDVEDVRFLRGNHEAALLDFLESPETGAVWMAHSGAETLYSYGVSAPAKNASPAQFKRASRELMATLPAAHLKFFQGLEPFVRLGDYLFVHAGLRPGLPLEKQAESDMLEIREPFLRGRGRWPFVVVHGHSPVNEALATGGRIALDTAAYATGKLSAVRLVGESTAFLST